MAQIRKKKRLGIIDTEDEEEPISYCPGCKKQDHLSILKERIYLPGQLRDPEHLALDNEGDVFVSDRKNNDIQVFWTNTANLYN